MKRYCITYVSGATGYGWEHETNSRREARDVAHQMSESYSAHVSVWDAEIQDCIYEKRVLEYKPEIDNI